MVFDIELTQKAPDRYIARVLLLPDVVVEATSRAEALERVRAALRARHRTGVEIVQVAIENETVPLSSWRRHAGTFPDDDLYRQMLDEVERNRRDPDNMRQ